MAAFRTECTDAETEYFDRIAKTNIAQCVLGGVGVVLELLVLSTIFAYNKDRSEFWNPSPAPVVTVPTHVSPAFDG